MLEELQAGGRSLASLEITQDSQYPEGNSPQTQALAQGQSKANTKLFRM